MKFRKLIILSIVITLTMGMIHESLCRTSSKRTSTNVNKSTKSKVKYRMRTRAFNVEFEEFGKTVRLNGNQKQKFLSKANLPSQFTVELKIDNLKDNKLIHIGVSRNLSKDVKTASSSSSKSSNQEWFVSSLPDFGEDNSNSEGTTASLKKGDIVRITGKEGKIGFEIGNRKFKYQYDFESGRNLKLAVLLYNSGDQVTINKAEEKYLEPLNEVSKDSPMPIQMDSEIIEKNYRSSSSKTSFLNKDASQKGQAANPQQGQGQAANPQQGQAANPQQNQGQAANPPVGSTAQQAKGSNQIKFVETYSLRKKNQKNEQ